MYSNERSSSKKRGLKGPNYTKAEFKAWVLSQPNFMELYNDWVDSGYDRWYKPSADRIDNMKDYTLSNLQLMTAWENHQKSRMENGRRVIVFTRDGHWKCEYDTIEYAKFDLGITRGEILKCDSPLCTWKGLYFEVIKLRRRGENE
jgi:hypothetical protein